MEMALHSFIHSFAVYLSWCRNGYLCLSVSAVIMMSQKCITPLPYDADLHTGIIGVAHRKQHAHLIIISLVLIIIIISIIVVIIIVFIIVAVTCNYHSLFVLVLLVLSQVNVLVGSTEFLYNLISSRLLTQVLTTQTTQTRLSQTRLSQTHLSQTRLSQTWIFLRQCVLQNVKNHKEFIADRSKPCWFCKYLLFSKSSNFMLKVQSVYTRNSHYLNNQQSAIMFSHNNCSEKIYWELSPLVRN